MFRYFSLFVLVDCFFIRPLFSFQQCQAILWVSTSVRNGKLFSFRLKFHRPSFQQQYALSKRRQRWAKINVRMPKLWAQRRSHSTVHLQESFNTRNRVGLKNVFKSKALRILLSFRKFKRYIRSSKVFPNLITNCCIFSELTQIVADVMQGRYRKPGKRPTAKNT